MNFKKLLPWAILVLLAVVFMRRYSGYASPVEMAGRTWKYYAKTDFAGGDLQALENLNRADCAQKCTRTTGCIGFGRSGNGPTALGSCWLKKTVGNKGDNGKVNTYFLA